MPIPLSLHHCKYCRRQEFGRGGSPTQVADDREHDCSCHCQWKKVLFVAEKMAALEVVKSRLEAVGLGEFCSLQARRSTGAGDNSILDRLDMHIGGVSRDYDAKIAKFREARSELAAYIDVVAQLFGKTGFSVYEILGKSIATNHILLNLPRSIQTPEIGKIEDFDRSNIGTIRQVGLEIEEAWRNCKSAALHWRGVTIANLIALQPIVCAILLKPQAPHFTTPYEFGND